MTNLNTKELTGDVEKQISSAGEKISELKEVSGDIKDIKESGLHSENLSDEAEQRLTDAAPVDGIKKNISIATEKQKSYEAMVAKYKDKKLVTADMKRKMANIANDQINQSTPQIKEAQEALMKQKGLLGKSQKIKGVVKKRENILGGKPFGQRFIPGLTFQTTNRKKFIVDFGLQGGYRFTEKIMAGAGLTYAVAFSKSYDLYTKGLGIYGSRFYGDFFITNGFYAHGEFTWGHYKSFIKADEQQKYSTVNFNTGIGKQFNLSRRVKGTMLALYRFDIEGSIPHQSKLNLRFGFDLYPKRKKKDLSDGQGLKK